jgi:hypothetical protein
LPLSIFRIRGLAAADATQLIGIAGFLAMFFFLTLYMQNVLGYSPIQTGAAYLPVCLGVAVAAGVTSQLVSRTGTRPLTVTGALIAAGGVYWLSLIPVDGSYLSDLLPGLVVMSIGLGALFVAVTTAANAGVPADKPGLAAALLNASQQLGGALGLANLHGDRHLPHQRPARPPRAGPGRAHLGFPPGAAGQLPLPARRSRHRPARDQHPRRDRPVRRRGTSRAGAVMTG